MMSSTSKWTTASIPTQTGRVAVVTGANSGIGFETAKALAAKGAVVVMACRNLDKAKTAAAAIRQAVPTAQLEVRHLDLADLGSVEAFAEAFGADYDSLDLLINNAGVMVPPLTRTEDNFEVQFGANHLGHFALTGRLMEQLQATPGARVVNVSSAAHKMGRIDFDNLHAEKGYRAWGAYGQSKLANLLFTLGLNRVFAASGTDALAAAAHPGWTGTNLQANSRPTAFLNRFFAQTPAMGALPTLYAATAPDVGPNDYFGPDGFQEMRGYPEKVSSTGAAKDAAVAERLWQVSEMLTDVRYGEARAATV